MKILIQKIKGLKIYKDEEEIFNLDPRDFCFLIYVGFEKEDKEKNLEKIVEKIENLQIIEREGKFSQKIKEIKPNLIFISNITLIANFEKGRINFNKSLEFIESKELFEKFIKIWRDFGYNIFIIPFGSFLKIESINIGPVNFCLDL